MGKKGTKPQTLKKVIIQSSLAFIIILFVVAYGFVLALNVNFAVKQESAQQQTYEEWCKQELTTRLSALEKAISMIRVDDEILEMFQRNLHGIYYSDPLEKMNDAVSLREKAQNICSALELHSIVFFIPYNQECPTGLMSEYVYNDRLLSLEIGDKSDVLSANGQLQYNYGVTGSSFWNTVTESPVHGNNSLLYTSFFSLTNHSRTEYYGCVAISMGCSVITRGIASLYGNSDEYTVAILDNKSNTLMYSNGESKVEHEFVIQEYQLRVKQSLKTSNIISAIITSVIIFLVMAVSCIIIVNALSRLYKKVFGGIGDYISGMNTLSKEEVVVPQYEEFIAISENFDKLIERLNGAIREKSDYEVAQKEAQLLSLQYQINPHFMFNMIEVFRMRLESCNDIEASRSMKDFGQFMRYNLSGGNSVTLEEEVKMATRFIGLFKFKYGDRLSHQINLPENLKKVNCVKFILQPIVENSIKYGFSGKNKLNVVIDCYEEDGFVVVSVTDNGAGINEQKLNEIKNSLDVEPQTKYSIGLSNVYRRIKLFYGENSSLTIDSKVGEYTCIKIKFSGEGKYEDSFN